MLMKDSGYFVGYVGKNHTPLGRNEEGTTGYNSGVMEARFDYWYSAHGHIGFYPKERRAGEIFHNAKADTQIEILEESIENFMLPNEAFKAGYSFLESRPKDQPFALLINFNLPHGNGITSMEQRDSDLDLYKSTYRDQQDQIKPPSTFIAEADILDPKLPRNVHNGKYIATYDTTKSLEALREHKIREMQTISGIDKLLGKLQAHLEEQGIADNTMIVFTSDHGIMNGEHGLRGKVLLYDPSIRVPLVIYNPKLEQNKIKKSTALVGLVDIAPTILESVGIKIPETMQGESMLPLIKEHKVNWRKEIFLENMMTIQGYPRMEGVRTHKWKYIRYFDNKKNTDYSVMINASIKGEQPIYEELFDLETDPLEKKNVVSVSGNSVLLKQFRQKNTELVTTFRGDLPLSTYPTGRYRSVGKK